MQINQVCYAQQCQGSFGDPIVNITFGSGANPGAALSAASTNYQYAANDCPNDGYYTVRSNTFNCFGNSWFSLTSDHTGNANGYFMLVNASIQPSAFYIDTVRGLCANSTYEFAAWIINMSILQASGCGGNPIQPNITFAIEKLDGTVLQTSNTNNIPPATTANWNRYGLVFTTPAGVSDIVLRMTNNATGGCGNDLALDDITFRRCGPQITPSIIGSNTTAANVCEGTSKTFNITASVSAGFAIPVYQWQQSFNGAAYTDIVGENALTLNQSFTPLSLLGIYKYRIAVAEQGTLNSINCRVVSNPITINVIANPTVSINSNSPVCQGQPITLNAIGASTYNWVGPNGFASNTNPTNVLNASLLSSGTYSVLGTDNNGCSTSANTNIILNAAPIAATSFADSTICNGVNVILNATGGLQYEWSPIQSLNNSTLASPTATSSDTTNYRVVVKNQFNCTDTAYVKINVVKKPIVDAGIDKFIVQNSPLQLNGNIVGAFANFNWTSNNGTIISNPTILNPITVVNSDTKFYLTVHSLNNCGLVTDSVYVKIYNGLYIPNTFTPNGDNKNDVWNIPALEAFPQYTLVVYNRFGEKIFERNGSNKWDGTYKGKGLPIGNYIYIINLNDGSSIIKGTVLLLR